MTDHVLQQIIDKSREAKNGGFDSLSTGEQLVAALVLNRHYWLTEMGYTMAEAIDWIGSERASKLHAAALQLEHETSMERP
jgi:hypothetical protein